MNEAVGERRVQAMKKSLLAIAAASLAFPSLAQDSPTPAGNLRALADQVSEPSLRAIVERLVSFGTRHTLSARDHPTR